MTRIAPARARGQMRALPDTYADHLEIAGIHAARGTGRVRAQREKRSRKVLGKEMWPERCCSGHMAPRTGFEPVLPG